MSPLVLGLVLAAAGSTELDGAVTAGGLLFSRAGTGSVQALAHGRVDLARDFGRFFVEARASMIVRGSAQSVGFSDLGSRLTLGVRPTGFVKRVALEVLPFTPALRLPSFDWANAWGNAEGLAPVVTGEVSTDVGSFFLSGRFKTALNLVANVNEVQPDLIAGAEVPLPAGFQLEVRAAYLSYGLQPALAQLGLTLPMFGAGGGARVSWTWNEPVGPAVDLVTFANDPLRFERFFVSESRRSRYAAWVGLEAGGAAQQLADPDNLPGQHRGKAQAMGWVDAQVRVRLRDLRLFATARVQSVTHTLFDSKGVPPGYALAPGRPTAPLVAGFLGADWTFRALKLTPGLLVGLTQPGWIREPRLDLGDTNPPPGLTGPLTLSVRSNGLFGIHEPGVAVAPFLDVKVSARWEVLSFGSVVAEVDVEKDFNEYRTSAFNPFPPQSDQLTVRGQVYLQARF